MIVVGGRELRCKKLERRMDGALGSVILNQLWLHPEVPGEIVRSARGPVPDEHQDTVVVTAETWGR